MKVSVLSTLLAICLVAFAANVNSKSIDVNSIENINDSKSIEDSNGDVNAPEPSSAAPVEPSSAAPESSSAAPEESSSAAPESSSQASEDSSSASPEPTQAPEDSSSAAPESSSDAPQSSPLIETTTVASEPSTNTPLDNSSALTDPTPEASSNAPEETTTDAPESSSNAPEETTTESSESSSNAPEETTTEAAVETTVGPDHNPDHKPDHKPDDKPDDKPDHNPNDKPDHNPDHKPDHVQIEELEKFVEDMFNSIGKLMVSIIDSVSKGDTVVEIPNQLMPNIHKPVPIAPAHIEPAEIEPRTFKTLWWILKSVLKTLRGINCSIKAVVNVKVSTEQMLKNFQNCGVETSKQIQAVLDSAQKVISISNDIMNINDNVCNNPDYSADVDSSQKASSKCVKQLRSQILSLNSQIKTTTKLIKKVPSDAGDCAVTTFSTYQQSIVGFPDFVKTCAKL